MKKSLWFYIVRFIGKVFKMHVYDAKYEYIVRAESFNKNKIISKAHRYILAKTYNKARQKIRGSKHKTYEIQNIDITLIG